MQTVAGQPYPVYVQQPIFAPLEMHHPFTRTGPPPSGTDWRWPRTCHLHWGLVARL